MTAVLIVSSSVMPPSYTKRPKQVNSFGPRGYFFYSTGLSFLFSGFRRLDHDRTLDSLAEHITPIFIYSVNIPRRMQCICRTAAGAVKPCPAVLAGRTRIYVAELELISQSLI